MKVIKIKNKEYLINHFDYFWNGSVLQIVNPKNGKISMNVPKKYYNDILFSNHKTIDCTAEGGFIAHLNTGDCKIIQMERNK